MTGNTTFPTWQMPIRQAQQQVQAEQDKRAVEAAMRQQAEHAARDARNAKQLQTALDFLGIAIPLPDRGEVDLDGVIVQLRHYEIWNAAKSNKVWDEETKDWIEAHPDRVRFTLRVIRRLPEADAEAFEDAIYWDNLWQDVDTHAQLLEGGNWLPVQAKLADAIDAVNAGYAHEAERIADIRAAQARRAEQQRLQPTPPTPPRAPTAEETLLIALKAFIRAARDDYDFDRILDEACE
ncbi:MAG: hypothetical protein K8L97_01580 [Anaerolineae bacterium]|nr:hypothetical protein [Anaerolineae bacterium]